MRLQIVVNGHAGSGKGEQTLMRLEKVAKTLGIFYQVRHTERAGQLPELIQEVGKSLLGQSDTKLLVIGGDGTLNEAVNGLKQAKIDLPIAYFPSGTGNDFARQFKIDTNPLTFLKSLMTAEPTALAIMRYKAIQDQHYRYAINSLGFGFDGLIVHLNEQNKRKSNLNQIGLGKLSYLSQIVQAYKRRETLTINLDTGSERLVFKDVLLATAMNHAYFGGGIKLVPGAENHSGHFSLVIAHHITLPLLLRVLPHILMTGQHFSQTDKLRQIDCHSCLLTLDKTCYAERDGEVFKARPTTYQIDLDQQLFWKTFD